MDSQKQNDKSDISSAPPLEHKWLLALQARTGDTPEFDDLATLNHTKIYLHQAVNDLPGIHICHTANKVFLFIIFLLQILCPFDFDAVYI